MQCISAVSLVSMDCDDDDDDEQAPDMDDVDETFAEPALGAPTDLPPARPPADLADGLSTSAARSESFETLPPSDSDDEPPLDEPQFPETRSLSKSKSSGGMSRSRSLSSLTASTVLVVDPNNERRRPTVADLSSAVHSAGVSAAIRIVGVSSGEEALAHIMHARPKPRLVLLSPGLLEPTAWPARLRAASGSPTASPGLSGEYMAIVLTVPTAPSSAGGHGLAAASDNAFDGVTASDGVASLPLKRQRANELLWRYVIPFGAVRVSAAKPLSALRRDLGDKALSSLRDGGLRGLLSLLHRERRRRSLALDQLLDARIPDEGPDADDGDDARASDASRNSDGGAAARVSADEARLSVESGSTRGSSGDRLSGDRPSGLIGCVAGYGCVAEVAAPLGVSSAVSPEAQPARHLGAGAQAPASCAAPGFSHGQRNPHPGLYRDQRAPAGARSPRSPARSPRKPQSPRKPPSPRLSQAQPPAPQSAISPRSPTSPGLSTALKRQMSILDMLPPPRLALCRFGLATPQGARSAPATPQLSGDASRRLPPHPRAQRRRPAVLVVDDSQTIRTMHSRIVRRALERAGVERCVDVVVAADGHEATRAISCGATEARDGQSHCFVLCLLDLHMPNLDGAAAARALRRAGSTAPLVAVTGALVPAAESGGVWDDDDIALSFDDVISKPLGAEDAHALVLQWVVPRVRRDTPATQIGAMPTKRRRLAQDDHAEGPLMPSF
mmetsp:Transcript_20970/g.74559  ORF Transcript_20970/g.74559 Transcript_20970/m.74559 type:complete len:729 (-) Transcript_20970:50-2236(-)